MASLHLGQFERRISQLRRQVETGFLLSGYLLEAHDEQSVVRAAMNVGYELLDACGSSFVPFDEWRPTLPGLTRGRVPDVALKGWGDRLSAAATRQACKICQSHQSEGECVLLDGAQGPREVHCVVLRYAGRELGVLNYYFEAGIEIDEDVHSFLKQMVRSVDLAIGSLRERTASTAVPSAPHWNSLAWSDWLLKNLHQALDLEFAWLWLPEDRTSQRPVLMQYPLPSRKLASPDLNWLNGLWRRLLEGSETCMLENVGLPAQNSTTELYNLTLFPLTWQAVEPVGFLILGSLGSLKIAERQSLLLQTLAGQVAMLVQDDRLRSHAEYQAVLDERTRLAREIHDGLAQTLAFLKLEAAHMQDYLAQGQIELLNRTLKGCCRTLSDAYLDARQAIDDLRHAPQKCLEDWLRQTARNFEELTGLPVEIPGLRLPHNFSPAVQAQLVRILQEALNNIRKHAQASRVTLAAWEKEGMVTLELSDDGIGFPPQHEQTEAKYGLRGMRERAEMIGADFQIVSRPAQGTTLRLQVPIREEERL
jgi:two-component system nitrate/nitrite sensor histidine kinase NarX